MTDLNLTEVKSAANGMLSVEVYRAIYETARAVEAGDALEIGTAHGAATIAMAAGLRAGKVVTIDKIKGGSRDRFGDVEHNKRTIFGNFQRFGVQEKIDFHMGTPTELAPLLSASAIGLLMLDADGVVDRDFRLFYDRLLPGARIIIDDYEPGFVRCYKGNGTIDVDQKCRITALLVDYFESKGYLSREMVLDRTWFGHKPSLAPTATSMNAEEICALYHQLTFASGKAHGRTAEWIAEWSRKFPGFHATLKRWYVAARS